jgi:hypothetical protein
VVKRGLAIALLLSGCFEVAGYGDFSFSDPVPVTPVRTRIERDRIEKIDLLLVVDNSRGVGDKQVALEATVAPFLASFLDPPCLFEGTPVMEQPAPDEPCPEGSAREIKPVLDVHVGIIHSSLGGHGGDACSGMLSPSENGKGHLQPGSATDYQDLGFLAWDPAEQKAPPGETDVDAFTEQVLVMLGSIDSLGCGYEAQNEAWYRFLVEPDPYDVIEIQDDQAVLLGTDQVVLDQRASFLRDDSLVVIAVMSDENDCSTRDGGQYFFAAQVYQPGTNTPYHLPKPRAACAVDPNDPCCTSCGQSPGVGCDTSADDCSGPLEAADDHVNLRCFDQKRRFGIDFLWPIDRYVTGLTASEVTDRYGNVVPNPLLRDRDPSRVVLTTIVGVPWQDVARRDGSGSPDLLAGLDAAGQLAGGFMNGAELQQNGVWEVILGDPLQYHTDAGALPDDPLMHESIEPRTGTSPIVGELLAPPTANHDANSINGHERSIDGNDDLQYTCIYPLATPKDCDGVFTDCDCGNEFEGNPVCQSPLDDTYGTIQYATGAKPGLRHLQIARALGSQAVVASVCVPQLERPGAKDYGYTAAFEGAIRDRVRTSLREQLCLEQPIANGAAGCVLFEASQAEPGTCSCEAADGRRYLEIEAALEFAKSDPEASAGWNCFCEIVPAAAPLDLDACRNYPLEPVVNESGKKVDGWCYLDPTQSPPLGNPAIAAVCPASRPHTIRVTGEAAPREDATLFLYCN